MNNEYYPRKLECTKIKGIRFKSVHGGATHSVAVTANDNVFGWGSNEKNQLNLEYSTTHLEPMLLPIFDTVGNYSIEELKNFGIIKGVNNNQFSLKNDVNQVNVISDNVLNVINDLSFNENDLMKIKLLDCGTWFTVCVSQIFSNTIFIFGNSVKKVLKITYFHEKKIEIMQISASNNLICVLTDNGIFKINVNNFQLMKNGEEVEKIKAFEHVNFEKIERIGCGADYILALTNKHQIINCQNFENLSFLNTDLKQDIQLFGSGPSHFFLVSNLDNFSFGENLFKNLKNSMANKDYKNFDYFIKSSNNLSNNFLLWPAHSFILEQYIDLNILYRENNILMIPLNDEKLEYLLELMYTNKIFNSSNEENNKELLENSEIFNTLIINLNDIKDFLSIHQCKNTHLLINLIKLYIDKFKEIINFDTLSKEFQTIILNKFLVETSSFILNQGAKSQLKDTFTSLKKSNSSDLSLNDVMNNMNQNNDDQVDDEENLNNNRNIIKFKGKGIKMSIIGMGDNDESKNNLI